MSFGRFINIPAKESKYVIVKIIKMRMNNPEGLTALGVYFSFTRF